MNHHQRKRRRMRRAMEISLHCRKNLEAGGPLRTGTYRGCLARGLAERAAFDANPHWFSPPSPICNPVQVVYR